jgi:hypothetical protein
VDWTPLLPGTALWALALYLPLSVPLGRFEQALAEFGLKEGLQQLALGGYALPLQTCARSGTPLEPPIGDWDWRCSVLSSEGLVIGGIAGAQLRLNPSELALLQRLPRPHLPRRSSGELLGPEPVWLKLLELLECWCREHLNRRIRSLALLRSCYGNMAPQTPAPRARQP